MRIFTFRKVRIRLTFWFLLIALIPLCTTLVMTYTQQVNVIQRGAFDKLTAIRDLKVERLKQWLDARLSDLNTAATDRQLTDLENIASRDTRDQNDIKTLDNARRILNRYLSNYQAYEEMFIINPKTGRIIISTNKSSEGLDKSKDTYFTEPIQSRQIFIKDVYYSRKLARNTMTYSIPIFCARHSGKHIVGLLVARIDLQNSLYALLLERVGLGETGETLIVNKEMMALNELRWQENAPLKLQIHAEPVLRAAQGKTGIVITTDYRGEKVLAAYTFIPKMQWGFVSKQDLYELNAPVRDMLLNYAILFILTGVMIYLVSSIVSKTISEPIINMNIVSQKMQSGDFSLRNEITSSDELGALGRAFNKMTDSIESRIEIQNSVSNISKVMLGKNLLKEFSRDLLESLMTITGSNLSVFYVLNEDKSKFQPFASIGANEELLHSFDAANPEGEFAVPVSSKQIHHIENIPEDTIFKFRMIAGDAIPRETITIPIVVDGNVIAIISLANLNRFSRESLESLNLSLSNMNTSYSNLIAIEQTRKLAEQLQDKNIELQEQAEELHMQTEELQQQSEELQEQNLELDMQKNQLEMANRLKSEFLSNMSHELRTPLNSIMALSQVLISRVSTKLSKEEIGYLEVVERNSRQLSQLINDILDLSKIEAGQMEIIISEFSIKTMIENITDNFKTLSKDKGISIVSEIDPVIPKIKSDEFRVHQVLENLIGNAVKFTKKGKVTISATCDENQLFVTVKDTGVGIPQKELPFIFEKFRQVDGTTARNFEGTGLGLAIAFKSSQLLGGTIEVESVKNQGSTFTVILPLQFSEDEKELVPYLFQHSSSDTPDNALKEKFRDGVFGKRILLVDDREDNIIQMKLLLEGEGFNVDTARGGKEAIDYLKRIRPDGIILDLMMPEFDGFQVLQEIRASRKTTQIPVLVLTAKNLTQEDLEKLSTNNIQQLIQKGRINKKDLLKKIKLMLSTRPVPEEKKVKKVKTGQVISIEKENVDIPVILVVEDNPDNMETMRALLKGSYKILEATGGENGLQIASKNQPDLILLDIMLPDITGYEVVKKLRSNKNTRTIPLIAVTAKAMVGDREEIIDAGCDDYLAKPINQQDLIKTIEKWLGKK